MREFHCFHISEIMASFLQQVSLRQMVCFVWFTFVDMYFSEIAVRGVEKLEKIKDGRYLLITIVRQHAPRSLPSVLICRVLHLQWCDFGDGTACQHVSRSNCDHEGAKLKWCMRIAPRIAPRTAPRTARTAARRLRGGCFDRSSCVAVRRW
jgi:hypothetical protein